MYGSVNASLAELDREESARPMLPAELDAVAADGGLGKPPQGGAGAGGKPGRAKRLLAAEPAAEPAAEAAAGKRGAGARARAGAGGGTSSGSYGPHFLSALWHILESTITLSECEVYSYLPDMDADPLSAGCLWSFNFFFLHRRLNRVLYFAATAQPGGAQRKLPGYGSAVGSKFLRRRPEGEGGGAAKEGGGAGAGGVARPAPMASPSPLEEEGEDEDDRPFAGGAEGGEEGEGEEVGGGGAEGKDGADDAVEEQFEEEEVAAAVAAARARGKRRKLSSPARRGGRASSPATEEGTGEPFATLLNSVASPAAVAPRHGRAGFRR